MAAQGFYIPKYKQSDDFADDNNSGGGKMAKSGFYTPKYSSTIDKDEEERKRVEALKSQAQNKVQPVKIKVGDKEVEIDETTKQNWFKLGGDAKKVLKDRIGEDAFNQLKGQLDKEAPKQGLFDKVRDVVDANSAMDVFKRTGQGQVQDYKEAQRAMGAKDYTNPFQRVAFSVAEPIARGTNTIAGAAGKFGQGVSDLAGVAFASDPEEERIAKARAIARGKEDIAFSGKGGILGVGANFENAKELEDKRKLAGISLQTGADLASALPQGKAFKLGTAGLTEEAVKRMGLKVAGLNAATNVLSEGGSQLKKGDLDVKALGMTGAMGLAQPLAGYTLGKLYKGVKGGVPTKAIDDFAEGVVENAKANRVLELGRNAPETDRAFLLDAKNPVKEPKAGNLSTIEVPQVGKTVDPLEALKAEAKRYKSADEFVKAQGEPVYHGSNKKIKDLPKLSTQPETNDMMGKAFYVTDSKNHGGYYARRKNGNIVNELVPTKGANIVGFDDGVSSKLRNEQSLPVWVKTNRDAYNYLKVDKGIDDPNTIFAKSGVDGFTQGLSKYDPNNQLLKEQGDSLYTAIINPKKLQTKSQLTDLYNQANTPQVGKTQTIQTGFTRPDVVEVPKPAKLNAAQVKASKRIAEIDKITAQVQKNGIGKYSPDDLRSLLRERSDSKAILEGGTTSASSSATKALTEAPKASGSHLTALPDEGGAIPVKTMASLSGDSRLGNLDQTLYNNLKYSIKGLGGGKVGSGLERVAKMFDSEQAINSEMKNLEYQGKVAKGTADYTRKAFSDYQRGSASAQKWMESNENVKALTGAIRERAKATGGDLRAAQGEVTNYIKARSEMELQKLHDATGGKSGRSFDPAKRASLEADLAKYNTPEAESAFNGMVGAYKDMLQEDFDRGYLSAKEFKNLQDLPYDYTRQQRVVSDWERGASNVGKIGSKPGRIQKRAESTSKELLDPLETMMAYSQQRETAHLKNAYKEQVLGALQEGGEARLVTKNTRAEGPEISVRRNGIDEKYQVSPEIAKVLERTDSTQMGFIANGARGLNNIFKFGTTGGNVGFALRNIFVDLPSAAINSEAGLRVLAPVNLMTSYGEALGIPSKALGKMNKELWDEYKANVGKGATRVQQYDKPKSSARTARELVRESASLKERGINVSKNLGEMGNVLRGIDEQIARTEHATRFAVYRATKKRALTKGLGEEAATDLAIQASREATTDFLAGGTAAKKINMFLPYFNPRMQVARTMARSFEKRPVSTMMKMSATVGIPMIALTLHNTETPEKRAIYDEISPKTKEDYHIYIEDGATYDPETKKFTGVHTVRKPNNVSAWFDGARKYIEKTAANDPDEHATWLGALKDTGGALVDNSPVPITPKQAINSLPGYAKTPLEDYTNKSFYYGNQIVPDSVAASAENPEDQHYTNYSRTSKFLGGLLGKSPLVIDNYIKGNFGEVGTNVQNVLDRVTGGKAGMTNEEGKTYTDIGGRTFGNSLTRGFDAARGGEVQKQFWDTKNNVQHSRDIASKKVTSAVNNGDYTRAERLAQEYNDSIATKLTPFLRKYQDSPSWDPEWDGYLEGLFIKATPRALKSRRKKD